MMLRADFRKLSLVLIVLAFLLVSHPHQAGGQNPWGVLAGFHSVGVGRVDDGAVAAVLFNSDDELLRWWFFPLFAMAQSLY